jgi:hypothetical protein
VGVPVILVDPRNTSRTCPECGHCDKHNRPNQSTFSCVVCGYAAHADYVASVNISRRAVVNPPYCSDAPLAPVLGFGAAPEQSPCFSPCTGVSGESFTALSDQAQCGPGIGYLEYHR